MGQQPIFGLIAQQVGPIESGTPFGPLTPYFRSLIEYAATQGWQSYLFSPRDVLRQRQTIWGWVRQNGSWQRAFVAPPNVAYTRLTTCSPEEREILLWLRDEMGVQYINQPELDEVTHDHWRLIQILQSHPTLSTYVLDSVLLRDTQTISALLEEYPATVARSRSSHPGMPGTVLRKRGEEFLLRQEVKGVGHTQTYRSPGKVRASLESLLGEVILQQYVPPFVIEECPVTLRTLWQRTRSGSWVENAAVLRVGQPKSQTYQTVTAGLVDRYEHSLTELLGPQYKSLRYQVTNVGRMVVDLLDQRTHGAGELAVELLVTADRALKVLDVSTTNGIDAVRRLPDPNTAQDTMRATVQYAASLFAQRLSSVTTRVPIETR